MKMKPRKESDIQLSILKYLRIIGCVCGKTKTTGSRHGDVYRYDKYLFTGYPDISCFWRGKLYFIEVKAGRNTQTIEQKNFEQLCKDAGIPYILAYSLGDVLKVVN